MWDSEQLRNVVPAPIHQAPTTQCRSACSSRLCSLYVAEEDAEAQRGRVLAQSHIAQTQVLCPLTWRGQVQLSTVAFTLQGQS